MAQACDDRRLHRLLRAMDRSNYFCSVSGGSGAKADLFLEMDLEMGMPAQGQVNDLASQFHGLIKFFPGGGHHDRS